MVVKKRPVTFKRLTRKLRAKTHGQISRPIPEQQKAFLEALSELGSIKQACIKTKVPRTNVYQWRRANGGKNSFADKWDAALVESADSLEDEAIRRAHDGCNVPVYQGGRLVGYKREYSDGLMMFMLRARRPKRFIERLAQVDGDGNNLPATPPALIINFIGKKK